MGKTIRVALVTAILVAGFPVARKADAATPYSGPTPYTSRADAAFFGNGNCLEDFEDGSLDIPGATGNGDVVGPGSSIDSVDGDDGAVDGSGTGGHSYFNLNGSFGIAMTFDSLPNFGFPYGVGIVWTDGGVGAAVSFEAFDGDG